MLDIFALRGAFISKPKPSQIGSISNSSRLHSLHSLRNLPTKSRRNLRSRGGSLRSLCGSLRSLCGSRSRRSRRV